MRAAPASPSPSEPALVAESLPDARDGNDSDQAIVRALLGGWFVLVWLRLWCEVWVWRFAYYEDLMRDLGHADWPLWGRLGGMMLLPVAVAKRNPRRRFMFGGVALMLLAVAHLATYLSLVMGPFEGTPSTEIMLRVFDSMRDLPLMLANAFVGIVAVLEARRATDVRRVASAPARTAYEALAQDEDRAERYDPARAPMEHAGAARRVVTVLYVAMAVVAVSGVGFAAEAIWIGSAWGRPDQVRFVFGLSCAAVVAYAAAAFAVHHALACSWWVAWSAAALHVVAVGWRAVILFLYLWPHAHHPSRDLVFWCLIFPAVRAAPGIVLAVFVRRLGRRRCESGHCTHCGYNLYGIDSVRCPECGTIARLQPAETASGHLDPSATA